MRQILCLLGLTVVLGGSRLLLHKGLTGAIAWEGAGLHAADGVSLLLAAFPWACFLVIRMRRRDLSASENSPHLELPPALWRCMLLLGAATWLAWPFGFRTGADPRLHFLAAAGWLVLPALLGDLGSSRGNSQAGLTWSSLALRVRCFQGLVWLMLCWACGSVCFYFRAIWESVGGVDFFYYLCYARDMLDGVETPGAYSYFPGVYAFWRWSMWGVSRHLADLQGLYLLVLLANAAGLVLLIRKLTQSIWASLFAGLWYLVLCSRFQGFAGVTEPIATLPWVWGLWYWGGRSLQGKRGWQYSVTLGVALGVTAYTKQQAGMLALGYVSMWLEWFRSGSATTRHHTRPLLAIPLFALWACLLGMFLEGQGFTPLALGLYQAGAMPTFGSFGLNLYTQFRSDEVAVAIAGLACVVWVMRGFRRRPYEQLDCPWYRIFSFSVVAGLACIPQFARSPHGHYMLLAIPCLVLAGTLGGWQLSRWALVHGSRYSVTRFVMLWVALVPLFSKSFPESLRLWVLDPVPLSRSLWHQQPAVAHDLKQLAHAVSRNSRMAVFPARHNSVYFLLGTRSGRPNGYAFILDDLEQIHWDQLEHVLILERLDASDPDFWGPELRKQVSQQLTRHGFQLRTSPKLSTMRWYQRP